MLVIQSNVKRVSHMTYEQALSLVEDAGRICYQSEPKEGSDSETFVKRLIDRGHLSVIEHVSASYRIVCSRGVSHEIVRHRLASYSQESTRYCNYGGKELQFIYPEWAHEANVIDFSNWISAHRMEEHTYKFLLAGGRTPQEARGVLSNDLKTEMIMTANFREWRHFIQMRCPKTAHPDMRRVAKLIRDDLVSCYPIFFADLSTCGE